MRFAQVRENAGEGIDLKKPLKINGFCFYLGGADGTAKLLFPLICFCHFRQRTPSINQYFLHLPIKVEKNKSNHFCTTVVQMLYI